MSIFDKLKKAAPTDDDGEKISFMDHLEELRKRLIRCFIAIAAGFGVAFSYSQEILDFILNPVREALPPEGAITILEVTEGFVTKIKMSIWGGIFLTCPILFYQLWAFISPGLRMKEKKYVVPFVLVASFFFISGAAFCYYMVVPVGLKFLLGAEVIGPYIKPQIPIGSGIKFVTDFMLAFGIIFELPVAVFLLSKIGIINYKLLMKWHGMAAIIISIVAAIMTPTPDMISMLLMGVPLYFLYLVSIGVAYIVGPKPDPEFEDDDDEA